MKALPSATLACCLLFSIVSVSVAAAPVDRPALITIAVADLHAKGIEISAAEMISERLRTELLGTDAFRVMERSQMDAVLKEQGFQQSGACDNSECLVEMGQLLGVEQMLVGSVGKVGEVLSITVRAVNVASGEVTITVTEDCRCRLEDLLTSTTKIVAVKVRDAFWRKRYGALTVTTTPPAALVVVDSALTERTPATWATIEPGRRAVKVSLDRHNPIDTSVDISNGATTSLSLVLTLTKQAQDSLAAARRATSHKRKIFRQAVLGGLAGGCLVGGVAFNQQAAQSADKKATAWDAYSRASADSDFTALWDAYQSAGADFGNQAAARNVFYAGAGVLAVAFAVSFAF